MGKKEDPQLVGNKHEKQEFTDPPVPGLVVRRITHDLNNLVCGILGLCETAASRNLGKENAGEEISEFQEIEWAARQAALLLQQLSSFCTRKKPGAEIIYPGEVMKSTAAVLKRMLGEEVCLDCDIQDNGHPVLMEPGRLEQVLLNLVLNARDATPPGGMVTLKLESLPSDRFPHLPGSGFKSDSAVVKIEVKDNGHGIPANHREKIFEPYFTTKSRKKGSGLGLSTVKKIVEEAGGRIDLKTGPGDGTVFSVYLPVAK